jgi:hypothetical protein
MANKLIFILLVVVFALGPLGWRVWLDRLARRGVALRLIVEAALRHALGGESLVAVEVYPATAFWRGQIILFVPAGWDCLVKSAWDNVVTTIPENYDLVCRGIDRHRLLAGNSSTGLRVVRDRPRFPVEDKKGVEWSLTPFVGASLYPFSSVIRLRG